MSFVCVWIHPSSIVAERGAELSVALLQLVPRVALEQRGLVWADARALPNGDARDVAARVLACVLEAGATEASAGVAAVPIVAELAARTASGDGAAQLPGVPLTVVAIDSVPGGRGRGKSFAAEGAEKGIDGSKRSARVRESAATDFAAGSSALSASSASSALEEPTPRIRVIEPGRERDFLASLPLALLGAEPHVLTLLDGVGVQTCGALAALEREAVEVRFGAEALPSWRLARAEDRRRLFAPVPPERPHAAIEFVDYVVTDPERLVFTVNALLGSVCEALHARGEHARRMRLVLPLANGEEWTRSLRPARPTASRDRWLRMARTLLERLTVSDAVAAVRLEVEATERAGAVQGDLFDRGFATAGAVEAALARLLEEQGAAAVTPAVDAHPLVERRAEWVGDAGRGRSLADAAMAARGVGVSLDSGGGPRAAPGLTLQLLPDPRPIDVETVPRADHEAPVRYHDARDWHQLVVAAGPDRISGGRWEDAYAREYFRCVTSAGVLVWLYRDARRGEWFLHGWWD